MVESVQNIVSAYAYNKKSHNLYVRTTNGNFIVSLNSEYAKFIKNNKNIPQLSEEEIETLTNAVNADLHKQFSVKNDSIKEEKRILREKEIRDSLNIVNAMVARNKQFEEYRDMQPKRLIPNVGAKIKCDDCGKTLTTDYAYCASIQNDTIYFGATVEEELHDEYTQIHFAKISSLMKSNPCFMYHLEAYKDSLCQDSIYNLDFVQYYNKKTKSDHINRVIEMAPYGFLENWGWDDEYSLSFHYSYMNLNPKTIKYIDVYWKATNDVGDVRKIGNFKGTGPVEQYETGSWNWDSSSYYLAGDVTHLEITKIILTYMNGTQKVLGKNQFWVNNTANYKDEMKKISSGYYDYVSSYRTNENDIVDTPATYSKGAVALYEDIVSNLDYNHKIGKKGCVYCVLKLEIKTDGTIGKIKVDETLDDKYDPVAIEAARKLDKFVPASNKGEKVSVWFKLPVPFYFE